MEYRQQLGEEVLRSMRAEVELKELQIETLKLQSASNKNEIICRNDQADKMRILQKIEIIKTILFSVIAVSMVALVFK